MTERNETVPKFLTVLPDPSLFRAARMIQRICICIAGIALLCQLLLLFGPGAGHDRSSEHAGLPILLTGFLCTVTLLLSEPSRAGNLALARRAAKLLVIFAAAVVLFWMCAIADPANPLHAASPPISIALGFVLLPVIVGLIDNSHWLINRAVDVMVCGLCLLSMFVISNALFAWTTLFGGGANHNWLPAAMLVSLIALTLAVTLRQAEHGVLSIFLGTGHGCRLARIFTPVFLALSLGWQAVSARISAPLSAALVGALAMAVGVAILLFFSWRISRMENEMHDLVLRDEPTRLYNFKGFQMLAEHALRLAKRTNVPFSVLFIELENLAEIHSQHGQDATAASLAEAGEVLRATFRESDIKGRVGTGEFAVAGRFDRCGIAVAAMRLEAATAARTSRTQGPVPLRLSMGHVTTMDSAMQENLKDLLQRAGQVKNRMDFQMKEMRVN